MLKVFKKFFIKTALMSLVILPCLAEANIITLTPGNYYQTMINGESTIIQCLASSSCSLVRGIYPNGLKYQLSSPSGNVMGYFSTYDDAVEAARKAKEAGLCSSFNAQK